MPFAPSPKTVIPGLGGPLGRNDGFKDCDEDDGMTVLRTVVKDSREAAEAFAGTT